MLSLIVKLLKWQIEFIENEILQNKFYSINHREEIRSYAAEFEWSKIVEKYYIPAMETIIENYA